MKVPRKTIAMNRSVSVKRTERSHRKHQRLSLNRLWQRLLDLILDSQRLSISWFGGVQLVSRKQQQ